MLRRLLVASLFVIFARTAWGDVPPPPPPAGEKYVAVSNTVQLAGEIKDYIFVLSHSIGPGPPRTTHKKLNLSAEAASPIPQGGRHIYLRLIAVPTSETAAFKNDEDLCAAVAEGKVKGLHALDFDGQASVSQKIPGESVTRHYTITGIDREKGFQTKIVGEEYNLPKTGAPKSNEGAAGFDLRTIFAGLALSCAAVASVWIMRRRSANA